MDVGDLPVRQLTGWLGSWPPAVPVHVVVDPEPDRLAWDGGPRRVTGVADPEGRAPGAGAAGGRRPAARAARGPRGAARRAARGRRPSRHGGCGRAAVGTGTCPTPGRCPTRGSGCRRRSPARATRGCPPWLRPFGGEVLVALDEPRTATSPAWASSGTPPDLCESPSSPPSAARGRGLARRLVAQAARAVTAAGCAVLYLHAPDNEASARTARGSGFPDTGWRVIGFFEPGS